MDLVSFSLAEQQRLTTLRALELLDTPPEERFDRITRLATTLFNVPISQVTLIDEQRQWSKSVQGMDLCETPREQSFCAHTILQQDIMVIPDARLDLRFQSNPLVLGDPYIRFYAGAPFYALDGSALGSLCIIDRQPRQFSTADRQALCDLARWVEHEINIVQISQALLQRESEVRLRAMMESSIEAMLLLSLDKRILTLNRCFYNFFWYSGRKTVRAALRICRSHIRAAL